MTGWTAAAQILLSVATLAIAFAVYGIQADKLFLDMREKRHEALDLYANAARARLDSITGLNRAQIYQQSTPDRLSEGLSDLWEAERGIRAWFGPEIAAHISKVEEALKEAHRVKFEWCHNSSASDATHKNAMHTYFLAAKALGQMLDAAQPYIAAGRRGLPLRAAWRLRRERRPKLRPPDANVRSPPD